ncbi:hypothetical protein [Roseivirga sp.]|uniref:hypothetical protein n=1 Tax=Roseivirga sp. TaxID=1964215 RepID=UPI003B51C4E2
MLITRLKSVLIFAILAAVFSCADPYESSEVALENSRRAVQPEDIPHVTSKLFDRLGLANGTERFSMASATGEPEFTIDWEKILESIDSSGTATYTFYLHSNATRPGEFYNLVMRLDSENNAYKPFIVRYTMTDEFLQQYLATGSMEGFDGEMSIIPVKGPDSGTEYQASLPDHVRSITPDKDCPEENIGFDDGSSGGGGGGPSTGGPTGGGGSWVTVTRCDYYLVKNYYDTYVDGEYSSTNYYYTMEKDCYEYSYLSHTEVAGEDDCDLGDGEIPIIDPTPFSSNICNKIIAFDKIPTDDSETSFTGEVRRVHVPAVHTETGEFVEAFWGAWCVTFGTSANLVNNEYKASEIFKEAWRLSTIQVEIWLNRQESNPGKLTFSNQFLSIFNSNITALASTSGEGYVHIVPSTKSCKSVRSTWLTYCK